MAALTAALIGLAFAGGALGAKLTAPKPTSAGGGVPGQGHTRRTPAPNDATTTPPPPDVAANQSAAVKSGYGAGYRQRRRALAGTTSSVAQASGTVLSPVLAPKTLIGY